MSVRPASSIVPLELAGDRVLPVAALVFGATLVMLAVAGVNVAAVLLARAIRRRREMAVRASLGASPLRLVRQLAAESVLLALIATTLVVLLLWQLPLLAAQLGVPRPLQPAVDLRVLGYAVVLALLSGVLFALAPALVTIRSDVVTALRTGDADSRPRARAQRVLVAAQLALSMVLLIVGGALLRSLQEQRRVDPGFARGNLIIADFEHPSGVFDRTHEGALARVAVERAGAVPGVQKVSVTSMAPLTSDGASTTIRIPGYSSEDLDVPMITGGPDLFATLGIPMRRGRELAWSQGDTLARVVVNESMALRYWGTRDPVGTFIEIGGAGGRPAEVIAVSADARFRSLDEPPRPMFAIQRANGGGSTLLIRTASDPERVLGAVRTALSGSDVPLTLVRIRTMDEVLEASLSSARAISSTLAVVGVLAALLAALGLHGVVSYITSGRTREIGVRLALGATRRSISKLVLGYGVRLAFIGGAIGTIVGLAVLRAIGGMLVERASSAVLIAGVWVVLSAITFAACIAPARRAMVIPPASAFRTD
jgi:predicted permease